MTKILDVLLTYLMHYFVIQILLQSNNHTVHLMFDTNSLKVSKMTEKSFVKINHFGKLVNTHSQNNLLQVRIQRVQYHGHDMVQAII